MLSASARGLALMIDLTSFRGILALGAAAMLVATVTLTPRVASAQALPSYLSFLPGKLTLRPAQYQDWDQDQIPPYEPPSAENLRVGKHWRLVGNMIAPVAEPDQVRRRAAAWEAMKPDFLAAGWEVSKILTSGTYTVVLHYARNNTEAWSNVDVTSVPGIEIAVIEAAPIPHSLTLPEPAAKPEKILPLKDFPFLPPIAVNGTKPGGGGHSTTPFTVSLPSQGQPELVAPGSTTRSYHPPSNFSRYEWVHVYAEALPKAGWTIVNAVGTELITAHYGKNGRNIWAYLHMNSDGYTITVGDEPSADDGLQTDLAKRCHVVLLGVLFDFNKSTLKAESDPVLERVRAMMGKDAALHAEIQGHTDNVGTPEYNQTLSEARAAAVVGWLNQHGVKSDRLLAKGYGLTVPIADNRTDEGRAANRRVEIANPGCSSKP
jgi:OOP family OmpA-OmpF porin